MSRRFADVDAVESNLIQAPSLMKSVLRSRFAVIVPALLSTIAGCSLDALLHTTASLGGDTAGDRGNAEVLFVNNTPYRAVFTFGAYDELDENTEPELLQFGVDTLTLEGNTESDVQTVTCSRVFSIGGAGLIARVQENLTEDDYDADLLIEGVNFSSADVGEDDDIEATEGTAASIDAYIGPDFECGSLLIYRFEYNDAGPEEFIVELTVVPSESTR